MSYAIDNHVKPPRAKRSKVKQAADDRQQRTLDAYADAYKRNFGVRPDMRVEGAWVYIAGDKQGVSLQRLKELTTQLNLRAPLR
jgi:hypothetical protein